MKRLIEHFVGYLIRSAAIVPEDSDIYYYGLDVLLFSLINITLLLGCGILIGRLLETAILVFLFGLLQSCGGGYHASTHMRCFLGMLGMWGLCMLGLTFGKLLDPLFLLATGLFSIIVILRLAPVENPNAPAGTEKRKKSQQTTRRICISIYIVLVFLVFAAPEFNHLAPTTAFVLLFYAISLQLAVLSRKRIVNNNTAEENTTTL